jgi:hypothetical protein
MRWLKHIVPTLLVIAAIAVALATLFSDHRSDFGAVALPEGGTVELPKGTVKVFYEEPDQAQGTTAPLSAPLTFAVTPVAGGPALDEKPTAKEGTSDTEVQRSEDVGSLGSVANIEVPAEDSYVVRGSSGGPAGSSLTFGTSPAGAVVRRWHLLAGLLLAALLVALIPLPSGRGRYDEGSDPTWSSDSRFPYA